VKKIRLHKPLSNAVTKKIARQTLISGGFTKQQTADASGNEPVHTGIGASMPDGTVYAGSSPNNGRPLYVTPADAARDMYFDEATAYAAALDAHGHKDWRLPTRDELHSLRENRDAIGGFGRGHYWSSTPSRNTAIWAENFAVGKRYTFPRDASMSVRCVR
jgi:hypothetical protein